MQGPTNGRQFLARAIVAHMSGMSVEDFVQQELRRMNCEYCRLGVPFHDGVHQVMNLEIPCEAERNTVD